MPHYSSDTELYADLGECLREVLCDPENADRVRSVGSVIRIETVRPKAQITLNLAADADPEVALGDSELRPGAVITIDADALRDFFLGEASLIAALSGGKMKAQGPVAPILRVVPLANIVAPVFRERDGAAPADAAPADDGAGEEGAGETPAEEPKGGSADDAGETGEESERLAGDAAEEEPAADDAAEEEPAAEEPAAEEPAEEAQS